MFLDSLPETKHSDIGECIVLRMLRNNNSWRYNQFQVFKQFSDDGVPQYRDFVIGSPTTCLCEAVLLEFLSSQTAFKPHECAYSYQWPKYKRSGRNHSFYLEGYKERNSKITKFLRADPSSVALVTDIEKFYPSVDKDSLKQKISARLDTISDKSWRSISSSFFEGLLDNSREGIPIGPDIGHVLGHVALEEIDQRMYARFGEQYTRYVDDIIVVCEKHEVERTQSILAEALDAIGLKLNADKTDNVKSNDWLRYSPRMQGSETVDSFESLIKEILFYLNLHSEKADFLSRRFRDDGFSLPFQKLITWSKYSRLTRYMYYLSHDPKGLVWLIRAHRLREEYLLRKAERIKKSYMNSLQEIGKQGPPNGITQRRWYIQKFRYYINRLLYLLNSSEYGQLLEALPDVKDFRQTKEVIESVCSGDVSGLLEMPGRSISAFCEIWSEFKTEPPRCNLPEQLTDEVLESVSILALHRIVDVQPAIYENVSPKTQAALRFCSGDTPSTREFSDLSFIDELRSLQLNYSNHESYRFLTTRYNEQEGFSLEALRLGETSFSL
jgi:hypothetical protein